MYTFPLGGYLTNFEGVNRLQNSFVPLEILAIKVAVVAGYPLLFFKSRDLFAFASQLLKLVNYGGQYFMINLPLLNEYFPEPLDTNLPVDTAYFLHLQSSSLNLSFLITFPQDVLSAFLGRCYFEFWQLLRLVPSGSE